MRKKLKLAVISTLAVQFLWLSGCNHQWDIRGEWSIESVYDRGTFVSIAVFDGSQVHGTVVFDQYAEGEFDLDGKNVTFTSTFQHDELGLIHKVYRGTFISAGHLTGSGTVTYVDQDREVPLSWVASKNK